MLSTSLSKVHWACPGNCLLAIYLFADWLVIPALDFLNIVSVNVIFYICIYIYPK